MTGNFNQALPTGDYTVTFPTVPDYDFSITTSSPGGTPFSQAMTSVGSIVSGETYVINAGYTRHTGTLAVVFNDGGSGATYDVIAGSPDGLNLTNQNSSISQAAGVGSYQIAFDAVPGYTLVITTASSAGTPFTTANPSTGTIAQGETHTVTATYTRQMGTLAVVLNDGGSGATYDVTSSAADGLTLTDQSTNTSNPAPAADYTVSFDAIPGYLLVISTSSSAGTPFSTANPSTGTIGDGEIHTVTATYTRAVGTLAVVLNDGGSGATYDVTSSAADGLTLTDQSTSTSNPAPAADYTVSFDAVPGYLLVISTSSSAGTPFSAANPSTGTIGDGETHTVTATYTRATGTLDIVFNANGSGATYDVTSSVADGLTLTNQTTSTSNPAPAADYTVSFDAVPGYLLVISSSSSAGTPFSTSNPSTGTIGDGETHTVTATYTRATGTLDIVFNANGSGATYDVTSSFADGLTLSDQSTSTSNPAPSADYTITFDPAPPGYTFGITTSSSAGTPFSAANPSTGTINDGETHTVTVTYTRNIGSLTVYILPAVANANGAGWRLLYQNDFRPSGDTQTGIPEDSYFLDLAPASGYATPENFEVNVYNNTETVVTVIYGKSEGKTGSITVIFKSELADLGAQWRIHSNSNGNVDAAPAELGDTWFDSGETVVGLAPGDYTIEFSIVPGYINPAPQGVTIKAGSKISLEPEYVRPYIAHTTDYDGDGIADLPVYNPETKHYLVLKGSAGKASPASELIVDRRFGTANDVMTPGDYDGDGKTDLAYYRPKSGEWKVLGQFKIKNFGKVNDIPVPGDYDGDGLTDAALYSAEAGEWKIRLSSTEDIVTITLGGPTQTPVPANWNGDEAGSTEPAVYDVATSEWTVAVYDEKKGEWKVDDQLAAKLGTVGDIPVPGDYDGDGAADAAVFRPDERLWLTGGILDDLKFGKKGDFPVANVWAGEDRAVPAIFRPRKGLWQSYDKQLKARHGANGQPLISGKR